MSLSVIESQSERPCVIMPFTQNRANSTQQTTHLQPQADIPKAQSKITQGGHFNSNVRTEHEYQS